MIWIIFAFIFIALLFVFLGGRWEVGVKRPKPKRTPLVSILIPTYNSGDVIEETLKSIKNIDYPKMEILVADDSRDRKTASICRKYGAKYFENKKRMGKAMSLNSLSKEAKGEILFFIDSDTTISRDCLKKLIPWFSKDVGVVVPRFITGNRKSGIIPKLASIESSFINTLFKIHMYFGSMISFRGCAVAIKKSVFDEIGGWPMTQVEDNDFAARAFKIGYKLQYEPDAIVHTSEPVSFKQLKSQRIRWGKGSFYTFWRHKKTYAKSPQFAILTMPYSLLHLVTGIFALWVILSFLIPSVNMVMSGGQTAAGFLYSTTLFIVPFLTSLLVVTTVGGVIHITILAYFGGTRGIRLLYSIPYTLLYIPAILTFYTSGILSAIKNKAKRRPEIEPHQW